MKKQSGCGGKLGVCLGAPVRALSRACDSACDLYVRGMSGAARRVPPGSSAGFVGRGFGGGAGAASLRLRVSSDTANDLVRAAAAARRHPRRVAAEPADESVDYGAAGKKAGAGASLIVSAAPAVRGPARKKGGAASMGTITEDEPCEFGPDGACAAAPAQKPPRRAGFGAVKARSEDMYAC